MKKLSDITTAEVNEICKILGEPFLSFMTNSDGKWDKIGLEISIETTSTLNGNRDDSSIWISKNGTIQLHRNNGDWGGSRYETINTLPVIDYLRNQGYEFKY